MTAMVRPNSVNSELTAIGPTGRSQGKRRRAVENGSYTAFCARVIRAAAKRVAAGDVEALADLARLGGDLDQALTARRGRPPGVRLLLGRNRQSACGSPAKQLNNDGVPRAEGPGLRRNRT
jgi:hypothetical protein